MKLKLKGMEIGHKLGGLEHKADVVERRGSGRRAQGEEGKSTRGSSYMGHTDKILRDSELAEI